MDSDDKREAPETLREYLASAKESLAVLVWIWRSLQSVEEKLLVRKMFVFMGLNLFCQALSPFAVSYIFKALEHRNASTGSIILLSLIAASQISLVQKYFDYKKASYREAILGKQQGTLDHYITVKFFEKSLGQHAFHNSTLNVSNIDKGRWRLLELQGFMLFDGFQNLIALLMSFICLWIISPLSGLIISVAVSINFSWSFFLNHKVSKECTSIDKRSRKLNRRRVERWEKVERVKTSGHAEREIREMDEEYEKIIKDDLHFWLWFIKHATWRDSFNVAGYISVLACGAIRAYNGSISVSQLYPIFVWAGNVVNSIWTVSRLEHLINWNMPSIKAKIEALAVVPEAVDLPDAVTLAKGTPIALEFRNVTYVYPEKPSDDEQDEIPDALRGVSFAADVGEKVAIIGQSGAGKSTLMKLTLRSMNPTSGQIMVNDCDLQHIHYDSWMRTLGYIPQKPQIFDGTIRYNLTYGLDTEESEKMTDEEIWAMMRELQIDFGKRLRKGIYTQVGHDGIELSGGQAQRLIIGAAAIKRPKVMLIDEATSSLDSTTERKVQAGLSKLLAGDVTAVIIAHRLSTVRYLCNKFVVLRNIDGLKNGDSQVEAVASSFEELYRISPTFRMLSDDQGLGLS